MFIKLHILSLASRDVPSYFPQLCKNYQLCIKTIWSEIHLDFLMTRAVTGNARLNKWWWNVCLFICAYLWDALHVTCCKHQEPTGQFLSFLPQLCASHTWCTAWTTMSFCFLASILRWLSPFGYAFVVSSRQIHAQVYMSISLTLSHHSYLVLHCLFTQTGLG